jgi:hypothetical protein
MNLNTRRANKLLDMFHDLVYNDQVFNMEKRCFYLVQPSSSTTKATASSAEGKPAPLGTINAAQSAIARGHHQINYFSSEPPLVP